MKAIFIKELQLYFGSLSAYLIVFVFLATTGLLLWVFSGYQNILDTEYAQLNGLFNNAPWLFLWLIPALCMHLFSESYRTKSSKLLLTRPITQTNIILGKYFAAFVVVLFSILPTLLYVVSLQLLTNPSNQIDIGLQISAYTGLILLASTYISISIFTSCLSDNQLISFVLGVIFCVFFYIGWEYIAQTLPTGMGSNYIMKFSINNSYQSISRGVIDSRDILFFVLLDFIFLFLTHQLLKYKR